MTFIKRLLSGLCLFLIILSCNKDKEVEDEAQFKRNTSIIWDETLSSLGSDVPTDLLATKDGGYIVTAFTGGGGNDKDEPSLGVFSDFWIIKIDQNGNIIWQNSIGGSNRQIRPYVISTEDGGYLVGGSSNSNTSFDKTEDSRGLSDYWLVKLNINGEVEWDKTIGGQNQDYLYTILETTDGYLIGGSSESSESGDKTLPSKGGTDIWLVKINKSGSIIWQNTYGGNGDDEISTLIPSLDGGYLISAYSKSGVYYDKSEPSYGDGDAWIFQIDSNGELLWDKTIGSNLSDVVKKIIQLPNGKIIAAGTSPSKISGNKTAVGNGETDVWLVGMELGGNVIWQKSYGGSSDEVLTDIIDTGENLFALAYSRSGISGDKTSELLVWYDVWFLKLSYDGELLDETSLRGDGQDRSERLVQTFDGNLLTVINSNSRKSVDKSENNITSFEGIWLVKLDKDWE